MKNGKKQTNNLVSVFTGWCQLQAGENSYGKVYENETFHIVESELFHQDDSSEALNDTKQEKATDAPVASYTGRWNRI